jgi:tetratricopeptide (TPR) repeat protein
VGRPQPGAPEPVKRPRLIVLVTVAALAPTVTLLGGALRGSHSSGALAAAPAPRPGALPESSGAAGNTAALVAELQARLRTDSRDASDWALLGLAYQQRARETGDPTYYPRSGRALRRALRLAPGDAVATGGLGSLALSRHRFREALALGRRALRLAPATARTYGVIGDALIELGRYDEAFRAFDTMVQLKPSLAAYARVSYARELLGRPQDAIAAMRLAVEASANQPEATAWARVQLGKIYWSMGRLRPAARQYRAALAAFPGYAYAFDALAQVEAARGHRRAAIALETRAVDGIPLPQFVALLGDLYRAQGQLALARRQYALIGVIQRLLVANGVKTDLETALFDVDHGVRLPHALALARRARAERPSIDGDDVLAWALARNGRCGEALAYSKSALRLGTHDALKLFHRGMIERCLGNRAAGDAFLHRALALNPHFSVLWSPVARKALL